MKMRVTREAVKGLAGNAESKKRVDDQGQDIMSPVAGTGASDDRPDMLWQHACNKHLIILIYARGVHDAITADQDAPMSGI